MDMSFTKNPEWIAERQKLWMNASTRWVGLRNYQKNK
ncbi:hypothetical protein AU15_09825 [Marinobacter salarius]|uniref:Uncharacterized protein n=1 Tax=Marinobacter salarius TaxID=1420917 RepID=W5Z3T2_9GAMM|nr:hypothetical protein AU15_09825 [Marinobacter salarius]